MCVAVVVKSPNRIPASYLQAMAEHNPDGGGVAWVDGDQVQYRKGLTWEQIHAMQDLLPRPFLMHFRIATRGGKIPELTHPFPIGMQAFTDDLVGMAPAVIIHNGTWGDFRKHVPQGIDADKVSDTQTAAYVAAWDESILDDVRWSNAIMYAKDANGKPKIRLRGQWSEFEGNHYSNTHWKMELDRPNYSYGGYNQEWSVSEQKWVTKQKSHQARAKTEPLVTRKKAEYSHQGTQEKLTSKRAIKRAKRAEKRAERNSYAQAMANYNRARTPSLVDTKPANVNANREEMAEWYKTWNDEQKTLFTKEQLEGKPGQRPLVSLPAMHGRFDGTLPPELTSEKYIPCPECGEDIKTIPCTSCAEIEAELSELEDLTGEISALNDDMPPDPWDVDTKEYPTQDSFDGVEGVEFTEDGELCLSGDRVEDWKKVDDWIRAQGIKV